MIKGLFFIFAVVAATAGTDEEAGVNTTQWMHAVEEIISHISLGPLKPDFTPEYVSKRTAEFAIKKQTNHFRANVATGIIQADGAEARVCIDPTRTGDAAVKTVLGELKERTFDVIWAHSMDECLGRGGLLIKLPEPAPKKDEL